MCDPPPECRPDASRPWLLVAMASWLIGPWRFGSLKVFTTSSTLGMLVDPRQSAALRSPFWIAFATSLPQLASALPCW